MANPSTEAGATHAPMSLLSRFVGIVVSPKATFEAVVAHPRWLGMLMLVTIIFAICVSLPMTTEAGREAALAQNLQQMQNFGIQVNDEMYANMEKGSRFAAYQTFASLFIAIPIMSVILAGILFGVFAVLMGGQATFKQLFAVYVHASVVSAVGQLFTGPLNYFRGSVSSATNLSVVLPNMVDEHSFVGRLLGMIDLFVIWWLVVLAIGLAVLYRRRTQPIATGLFAVFVVIILAVAAVMSAFGGTN